MAKLKIKDEHGKERIHELVDAITTIGRASANTIQVSDEKASRNHFRVEKVDGKFKVVDLGSTNGTRLNGNRITADTILKPNDQIMLGKTSFTYEDPDAIPAAAVNDAYPASSGGETIEMDPIKIDAKTGMVPDAEGEGPKYVLKVLEGKNPGTNYELGTAALTIGRHNASTIQIIDDAASNYHAEINREPIGYVLTDLGSTNGTRVRHKNKTEFEKIVKTPLSPGMQIRIGKTLLEYQNIGKPVEDDALFGTISLDPDKLEAKLQGMPDPRPAQGGMGKKLAAAAVLLLVFGGVVFAVVKMAGPDKPVDKIDNTPVVKSNPNNRIENPEFDDGTDDDGNPKHFRVERGSPAIKIGVTAEGDRGDGGAKKLGLQISTGVAKNPAGMTFVDTYDSFPVDPGKSYEFRGWMRNDADGLYGLHVVWIGGDRQFSDNPLVLRGQQEWKERSIVLSPPSWAQKARVGVYSQGKEGKTYFDSLSFKETTGDRAQQPAIKFGGVTLNFEGAKGAFTGEAQGERIIDEGTLVLSSHDSKFNTELMSAMKPEPRVDGSRVAFTGELYDFTVGEPTNYSISAAPGAAGVDLRLAVDATQESGAIPSLRFAVVGPAASGDIEITKGDGSIDRLQGSEDKNFTGIKGVLFNAGKTPQLDLSFEKGADVELKREGTRRRVAISFKGELKLALAPESVQQKQKLQAAIADLQKTFDAKRFGEAEGKVKALRDQFAQRFPQAKDEADKGAERIDKEWKSAREEIDRAIEPLKTSVSSVGLQAARDVVQAYVTPWSGGEHADMLKADLARITSFEKSGQNEAAEFAANALLGKAENAFNSKNFGMAQSYLKKILKDNPTTAAGKKAADLEKKYEAAKQREDDLHRITDDLMDRIKPYEIAKDYKSAIDMIEKSADYQKNRIDLQELEKKLSDLKRKRDAN